MTYTHDWIPSTLGHGESMCRRCKITNREAAALGELNSCPVPPPAEVAPDHVAVVRLQPNGPFPVSIVLCTQDANGDVYAVGWSDGSDEFADLETVKRLAAIHRIRIDGSPT